MTLTLTYQGPLRAKQRRVTPMKAKLRRAFHPQIREQIAHMLEGQSAQYVTTNIGGFDFISPARKKFRTAVDLDVLILTRSRHLGISATPTTDSRHSSMD